MNKNFDPSRLDVERFARQGGALDGTWPLAGMPRLAESIVLADSKPELAWTARGEALARPGLPSEIWLELRADAEVALVCQRCLQPLRQRLPLEHRLRFVAGEAEAARLDAESDDDVLALSRSLDLHELIEDELLLALPIVPRHAVCPQAIVPAARAEDEQSGEPNPFAVLQALLPAKPDG